ncbi:hypothetical protein L1077_25140 [Pseudoalteromonas luteoviolacea]|uniref:hypothetical protein n=1 Tax=Pseudoalteromonas luteoviolacea TaxID=43657 RepID=UPI001F21D810|nr:hypothetical protein [Pseudoalteromonas luteoviolacea]MCF6442713.1 hypothetical protein [Pseudoalteromonas luteoviolacea]
MSDAATYPTGLLSFTYHVANTESVKAQAQSDLDGVMTDFALTPTQQELITKISNETGLTDSLWEQYAEELRTEIDHDIKTVW